MTTQTITLETLTAILHQAAGADENVDFDGDILDAEFEELGYDSLALLETTARIERDYGVFLDDDDALAAKTPRALLTLVNDPAHQAGGQRSQAS